MNRIHIVGLGPRTGTTLIAEAMVACFEIDAFEEHEAPVTHLRRDAQVYLTKNPGDIRVVGPRLRVDPNFYVICMMRDPRDMIVSRHARNPTRYWAPLRFWNTRIDFVRSFRRHRHFLLIRYEEFVRDPAATQEMLQCQLPFLVQRKPFSEYHRMATPSDRSLQALGGLRAIGPESIGSWREHLPRVAGQLAQHGPISNDLIEFGYEADDRWLQLLDEVEPDMSPSFWPERKPQPGWRNPSRWPFARGCISAGKVLAARAVGIKLS
jgi:hypothetical protein